MFTNSPFEAIAKSFSDSVPQFNPLAMQDAIKPMQDNLKAWADLAQRQATEAQAVFTDTVESLKSIKDPQAALEVLKASSEATVALLTKNLKEATALSVGQFHATVDSIEKSHPHPETFAAVAKNLKAAASTAESTLASALEKAGTVGSSVKPAAKAKKSA